MAKLVIPLVANSNRGGHDSNRGDLVSSAAKTDAQFVNCLEDVFRKRGAMDKLLSDAARAKIRNRVLEVLRAYATQDWQSEPHFHHQNAKNVGHTITFKVLTEDTQKIIHRSRI